MASFRRSKTPATCLVVGNAGEAAGLPAATLHQLLQPAGAIAAHPHRNSTTPVVFVEFDTAEHASRAKHNIEAGSLLKDVLSSTATISYATRCCAQRTTANVGYEVRVACILHIAVRPTHQSLICNHHSKRMCTPMWRHSAYPACPCYWSTCPRLRRLHCLHASTPSHGSVQLPGVCSIMDGAFPTWCVCSIGAGPVLLWHHQATNMAHMQQHPPRTMPLPTRSGVWHRSQHPPSPPTLLQWHTARRRSASCRDTLYVGVC